MKAVTFFARSRSLFTRLAQAHSTEFHLTPVELWLLVKLYGHQDGIFAPTIQEIADAAKAEGEPGMPNIKTLEKSYRTLQDKGYVQVRRVRTNGHGVVWVRSVTMEAGDFPAGHDLLGSLAPSDEDLTLEIVHFNAEQRRPDIVRAAYDRRTRRERAAASNVIDLDQRRLGRAG